MKVKAVSGIVEVVVPPLVLEVTFETEEEMREFNRLIGPMPASGPTDCFYTPIGDHLEKYTGKRWMP
jgi:hypothetical protein